MNDKAEPLDDAVVRQIVDAIRSLSYGAVEITVHEGRVVQIDRRERIRIPQPRK